MIKVTSKKLAEYGCANVYSTEVNIDSRKDLMTVELLALLKQCYKAHREFTLAAVEKFLEEELDND